MPVARKTEQTEIRKPALYSVRENHTVQDGGTDGGGSPSHGAHSADTGRITSVSWGAE